MHDESGAPAKRVLGLVSAAVDGLGFAGGEDGPNEGDLVFVGRRYMAWIDQTGFVGKMNGLWLLDGEGDALDFVMRDPSGRPVNALIVGERGDGRFPSSYQGADHEEYPSRTPELDDDPTCADRDWCNQYGHAEAAPIVNARIPWWEACSGRSSFAEPHTPAVEEQLEGGGLRLVYEAPFVKVADGDGTYDGDSCGADWLFADGVRRRVLLRTGYELRPDDVVRTMQFVNPAGNPELRGGMGIIGGFVLTAYPLMHALKRWDDADVWRGLEHEPGADVVVGWSRTPVAVGPFTVENVGERDNDDVGACLCEVHGAIELGGGLLHEPVAGGTSSIVARRRLTISR